VVVVVVVVVVVMVARQARLISNYCTVEGCNAKADAEAEAGQMRVGD
jgi:hypothetical protein